MPAPKFESVDEYLAAQPPASRAVLELVRKAIRKALPRAEETITYQIPTYKVRGVMVIYFAGWKKHYALYPASRPVVAALEKTTVPYELEKGTVRFTYSQDFPAKLVAQITEVRAAEMTARKAK